MRVDLRLAVDEHVSSGADIDRERAGETDETGGWGTGTPGSSNVAGQNEQRNEEQEDSLAEHVEEYGSPTDG